MLVRVALNRPCTRVVVALADVRSGAHASVAGDDVRLRGGNAQARVLDRAVGAWQLPTRRLHAGVDLIRALGGGWSAPAGAVTVAAVAIPAPL